MISFEDSGGSQIMEIKRDFDLEKKLLYIEKIDYASVRDDLESIFKDEEDEISSELLMPKFYREVYDFSTGEAIFVGREDKIVIPEKVVWKKGKENF